MASRLLCRYARLLGRSVPQAPATAARLAIPQLQVQRTAVSSWITKRLMCEAKVSAREEKFPTIPSYSKLEQQLGNASCPEDILKAWDEHGRTGNDAAIAVVRWTRMMRRTHGHSVFEQGDLLKDPRLQSMMASIATQVREVWNSTLVNCLRALTAVQVAPTSPLLHSVETEVLWRIRKLNHIQLALLASYRLSEKRPEQQAIVKAAIRQLELRWTEITDAKTVCSMLSLGSQLSPTLIGRLQDKVLELVEGFTAEDIRLVCLSLSAKRRRSVPLLRALSYHLLQKSPSELSTEFMLDVIHAFGVLSFQQSKVFQQFTRDLLPRVPKLRPSDVTRCAKSLGLLKWLPWPLFEAFTEHYIANSQNYNSFQLCNLIMAMAKLGFQPSKGEQFYSKVHPVLEESLSGLQPFLLTDVVWSMCVLQQARPHYMLPLLQEDHISKLQSDSKSQIELYKLKALHIAASLLLEHPDVSKAHKPPSFLINPLPQVRHLHLSSLHTSLRNILQTFADGRTEVLRTGVETIYGWTIDGDLVLDCDNKPMNLMNLKAPHLPGGGGDEDLPPGARRIAVMGLDFSKFGSKSKDLLGQYSMMMRHLQLAGFIIVEVPYYDWLELRADWQKIGYLKDKLGKAVAEDMAK